MRRGTRVGEAYVALEADGTGLNDDIVDSLDGSGDDIDKAGNRHGRDYGDQFGEGFDERMQVLADRIGENLGKRLGKSISGSMTRNFKDSGENSLGAMIGRTIGESVANRMEETMAGVFDDLDKRLANVSGNQGGGSGGGGRGAGPGSPSFPSQGPDPDRDRAVWEAAQRMNERFDRERTVMLARAERADEQFEHNRVQMAARREQMVQRAEESVQAKWEQIQNRAYAMYREAGQNQELTDNQRMRLNATADRLMQQVYQLEDDRIQREGVANERMHRMAQEMNDRMDRDQGLMLERAYRMNAQFDHQRGRMIDSAYEQNDRYDRDRGRMLDSAHRMNLQFDRTRADQLQRFGRMQEQALRMNLDFERGRINGQGQSTGRGSDNDDSTFGNRIGRLLGGGSRNNFLNFIGKSIGNLVGLAEKAFKGVSKLFGAFSKGFNSLEEGAGPLAKIGAGFGAMGAQMAAMLANLPVLAIGIAVIVLAASALVSIMSALLAIITALVSTIVSAAVGAAGALAGALGAVAIAGGLVAIAFTSMTDAQRKMLSEAFSPLKAELTGLGQLMLEQMVPAFQTWADNLSRAIRMLAPLAQIMGSVFAQAGNTLTAAFSGPGFQLLTQKLGVYLPGIIKDLSRALGGFFNGFAGLLAGLLPSASKLTSYLADMAERFSAWASSAQGQNAIAEFMVRALDSLTSLWNAVREFSGYLSDVLFSKEAQTAGNSLFDGIADAFEGFRKHLEDGSLEDWFNRALDFGSTLMDVISALSDMIAMLDSSGVLTAIEYQMGAIATTLGLVTAAVTAVGDAISWAAGLLGIGGNSTFSMPAWATLSQYGSPQGPAVPASAGFGVLGPQISDAIPDLGSIGDTALAHTDQDHGGTKPDKPEYVNPYADWAAQMLADGNRAAADMRKTMREVTREIAKAFTDAAKAANVGEARGILSAAMESAFSTGESMVSAAQSALDSATQTLGSATTAADTAKALKAWNKRNAELMQALKNQEKLEKFADRLAAQKKVNHKRVDRLVKGLDQSNATLAEYAAARAIIARRLEAANQKLADAIAMRNDYRSSVTEATKAFGSIMTAQAKVLDGIEQALTAKDITKNLRDRLSQIRSFQDTLRQLLALGLSDAAYKQLVDAGVEQGSAYAEAILAGGAGAVGDVNSLTSQIDKAAAALGLAASNQLYQAGVDAAQGLVDGLESLSGQLDRAATRLGKSIADALKRELGIKSPSKVMRDTMDYVGDGIELGLDDQHRRVEKASNRLSSKIKMASTMNAAKSGAYGYDDPVSGNLNGSPLVGELHVHTPTEDPKGVAVEAVNELVGRL